MATRKDESRDALVLENSELVMGFLHVGEGESVEAMDWCLTLSLQWRGEYLDGNVW